MPKRFAAADLERIEGIGAGKREHGAGPKPCAAHQVFGAFERAARLSRVHDLFDVAFAQPRDEAEAELQRVIVVWGVPLTLSLSRKGRGNAVAAGAPYSLSPGGRGLG